MDRSRQAPGNESAGPAKPSSKKNKSKTPDPVNTSKAIEDTIAQLERNRAGEKDQEIEIEREVKKANRELSNLLSTLETPLSRIEIVQRKYTELLSEMKRTEREHVKAKKRADQLQKEKDTNRSELSKVTTVKEKLEKLCRELQKENKRLKDENQHLMNTESRMREELHNRLDGMADDVHEVIDQKENQENIPTNLETDELFRQKFKSFIDQYEMRELQFHSVLRTKELEVQYQLARAEQQRKVQEQEATKSRQLTNQVSTFSQTESELRSQLNIYVEKFKQVEDTLNNSNDLFLTFRKEMEEMSKKTKRLEKENSNLISKHEATKHSIVQMAEDRAKKEKEIELLQRKNDNLAKLCRGMQQQGRMPAREGELEDEGTESDYEDEDEDDYEYDEDTEEEAQRGSRDPPTFGPPPPPTPAAAAATSASPSRTNGKLNGQVNGVVSLKR